MIVQQNSIEIEFTNSIIRVHEQNDKRVRFYIRGNELALIMTNVILFGFSLCISNNLIVKKP